MRSVCRGASGVCNRHLKGALGRTGHAGVTAGAAAGPLDRLTRATVVVRYIVSHDYTVAPLCVVTVSYCLLELLHVSDQCYTGSALVYQV